MTLDFLNNVESIDQYWNQETVIFRNQTAASSPLPSANSLISHFVGRLSSNEWLKPLDVNINASRLKEDGSVCQLMGLDIPSARESYKKGFSLCFGDLSAGVRSIAQLKEAATKIFGFPELIMITGYLSPARATGILHFDRQHNFFIQKEGIKRWLVAEKSAVKNPHENLVYPGLTQSFFDRLKKRGYEILMPQDCGRSLYELHPGDVLYVPPGFYHSAETQNETSLHYTLTVEPACFWKDFNEQMFSNLLASSGKFFEDYRFINDQAKTKLFADCLDTIMSQPQNQPMGWHELTVKQGTGSDEKDRGIGNK
jgi:hypothetical protein